MLLKRRPYRDASDLVEGIGRQCGRFSAVVRSSRKGGSGSLEPPVLLSVRVREGPTLYRIAQPVLRDAFLPLRHHLERLLVAGFLSRLFLAGLPEKMPEPAAFELLRELLVGLSEGVSPQACGLWGQERLLLALGYSPMLDSCTRCGSPEVSGFSSAEGGVLCEGCYAGSGFALARSSLELCRRLSGSSLASLGDELPAEDVRAVGRVYKEQFQTHLGLPTELFRRVLPR